MRPGSPTSGSTGSELLRPGLDLVRRRLRLGRMVDAAALGGWIGVALSAGWIAAWLLRLLPLPNPAALLIPLVAGVAWSCLRAGQAFQPTDGDLALIIDRILGSQEAVVTALEEAPGPLAGRVRRDAHEAVLDADDRLRAGLPIRAPRRLLLLPLGLLLLAGLTQLPRLPERLSPAGPAGDPAAEAEALQNRKEALERELGLELPEELDAEFAELVEAMKRGGDADALADQAKELQDKLDDYRDELAESGPGKALEEAADALAEADGDAAQDLKDAAADGDLQAAKDAVDRMRERLENKPDKEREQAARELERAAEEASKSGMPGLSDALKQEAQRAREAKRGANGSGTQGKGQGAGQKGQQGDGQQGDDGQTGSKSGGQQANAQGGEQGQQGDAGQGQAGQGQQGQQGAGQSGQGAQQQSGQGGQSGGDGKPGGTGGGMSDYLDQLGDEGLGGDGLAQQQKRMEMSQGLANALGGAAGRVGEGKSGLGQGHGEGIGWGAGTSHTDEDGGNQASEQGFQDRDRNVEGRTSSWTTEYGQDHDEKRLQGVKALAASVEVPLGEGPVDTETFRLRGSEERSGGALLQAPPGYREAAEEAIQGEGIPRHYRDQVKKYFDAID